MPEGSVKWFAATTPPPRLRPSSETGIYLRKHDHRWRQVGSHTWPNGETDPVFTCSVCTDVICCAGVVLTDA